jgi:predicted Rossmann fold flavoprotein
MSERPWDAVVIGAGAAGMMCAAVAGQRGARVLLIDHAEKLAEKIRISGGGRCNFTNLNAGPTAFISENEHFSRSALARYTAADFIALVKRHRIGFHEKHRGQLFCDDSSQQVIDMLRAECEAGAVHWRMPCKVGRIGTRGELFEVEAGQQHALARHLVIATGGLSIPKLGASDLGYRIARQFGLRIVETRPGLVPLTFDPAQWTPFAPLAGISLEVRAACEGAVFDEDLLFTHRGLSGPAILQISSFWQPGAPIEVNLAPQYAGSSLADALLAAKGSSRQTLSNVLAGLLPRRLAEGWLTSQRTPLGQRIADMPDRVLRTLALSLTQWRLKPSGSEGYRKAEVTCGGVATDELSQTTFEAVRKPGLHFIGEVVDVTGWLGGYNFQWAWSSGFAAGQHIAASRR